MNAGRGDLLQKAQDAENLALQGQLGGGQPGLPGGAPVPGVFEGGGPGSGGVPDLAALAAAPNGAGVNPPGYAQVIAGGQQPGGTIPPGGVPLGSVASGRRAVPRERSSVVATSPRQNELLQLQNDITSEVQRDAPATAQGVFGDNKNHPDMANVSNQQYDDLVRQKYMLNDGQWLQSGGAARPAAVPRRGAAHRGDAAAARSAVDRGGSERVRAASAAESNAAAYGWPSVTASTTSGDARTHASRTSSTHVNRGTRTAYDSARPLADRLTEDMPTLLLDDLRSSIGDQLGQYAQQVQQAVTPLLSHLWSRRRQDPQDILNQLQQHAQDALAATQQAAQPGGSGARPGAAGSG